MLLMMSPKYQECAVHRLAGLEGQLNIQAVPYPTQFEY
jgi:hypothetical protein